MWLCTLLCQQLRPRRSLFLDLVQIKLFGCTFRSVMPKRIIQEIEHDRLRKSRTTDNCPKLKDSRTYQRLMRILRSSASNAYWEKDALIPHPFRCLEDSKITKPCRYLPAPSRSTALALLVMGIFIRGTGRFILLTRRVMNWLHVLDLRGLLPNEVSSQACCVSLRDRY